MVIDIRPKYQFECTKSGTGCQLRIEDELITYLNSRHEISAINLAHGNVDLHWMRVKATMKQPEVCRLVEAVAKELVIQRRISYAEVEKIIEEVVLF